ncbi:hypothetical protein JOM56_000788 [Amanita muscaria]
MAPKTSEESSATTFVIRNENAADVDVSVPGGGTDTITSKKSKTYSSRGSYTVLQTGSTTSDYFHVTFPGDDLRVGDFSERILTDIFKFPDWGDINKCLIA